MAKDVETKAKKLEEKKEKAIAKKAELAEKIEEIRVKINTESDENAKKKLRKEREALIAERDAITNSKDGMTIPMPAQKKKLITACVAIVLICAICCAYLFTGAARNGIGAYFSIPQKTLTGLVITDKEGEKHNIKVATYNYYYAMIYSNLKNQQSQYAQYSEQYGIDLGSVDVDFEQEFSKQNTTDHDGNVITWAQYMNDEVLESINSTYSYYYEAVKANNGKEPAITEENQKELDESIDDYKEAAKKYGFEIDSYLTKLMGKGVTEALFREEAKISYIADNYKTSLDEALQAKEYKDEDYTNYQKENKDDLISVDAKIFECENADTAKKFMSELNADGSNFADLASKYSKEDWDKEAYKDPAESLYTNVTKSTLQGVGFAVATADDPKAEEKTYSGLDWLFSKDRKAGESKQFSTSVVCVVKPARISDVKAVTVRHILITPFFNEAEDEESTKTKDAKTATAEQWAAAEKEAKSILAEYNKGDKTAESFGELAKSHSADGNAADGGIYEDVTPHKMVSTFNAWIFDSKRKAGDTGIVKTEFGYHIIYFESQNEMPVWKATAQAALASEESKNDAKEIEKAYSIEENKFGALYFQNDLDMNI